MPIYEYKCENCGKLFEKLSSVKDFEEQIIKCPKCKKFLAHKTPSIFNSPKDIKNDDNLRNKNAQNNEGAVNGHTIRFDSYSGIHVDESVKNMEISDLNFKMNETSNISIHPKAKVKMKNCKFQSED